MLSQRGKALKDDLYVIRCVRTKHVYANNSAFESVKIAPALTTRLILE